MTEDDMKAKKCQMTALTKNCIGSECAAFRYKYKTEYDEKGYSIKDEYNQYKYAKILPEQVYCGMAQNSPGIFN